MSNPFLAESLLRPLDIPEDDKAELWQHFQESATPDELAQRIAPLAVPTEIKQRLFAAKQRDASPVDRTLVAIKKIAELPIPVLDRAEKNLSKSSHPLVTKILTDAQD